MAFFEGSGKTTLLEALAGRQREGKITGNIMMNGKPLDKQRTLIKASTGYVKQKDLLLSTATVRETLEYSARLRLPTSLSDDEKMERVGNVITELGLTKCRDTPLGSNADGGGGNVKMGSGRGVSGGELKRVAIGVELITDPGTYDSEFTPLTSTNRFSPSASLFGRAY
jgi:ABC-type multidrug transport system ATPase subunit